MVALIWFFPYPKMLLFYGFAICLILNLLCEYAYSCQVRFITPVYAFFFKNMLRGKIKRGQWVVSGSTPVFAAAALVTLLFPQQIAAIALGVMLLADTAAALIGRRFGKHKTVNGKSLEGVIAFCVTGSLWACLLLYFAGLLTVTTATGAVVGVILASIAELFEKQIRMDDNFSIPLISGFIIWLSTIL
ncbi:MAG: phosphatidate cytidylyltransferase [Lentisphaeria bacterium]|nr:phosphatidate cytidylyltransferase [Lentisphaeria bacterium]